MMIDFHNHILPAVDDGAKTVAESIQMLLCAKEQGVTDVVNTVHFQHPKMEGKNTDYDYITLIKKQLDVELEKHGININIHLVNIYLRQSRQQPRDHPLEPICSSMHNS